jgi:hypothetical protein
MVRSVEANVKLLAATLFLNEPRLIAYAEAGGKRRRVVVQWMAVGAEERLPPVTWADSVRGEVEFQQGVEQSPGGALSRFGR